MLWLCGLRIPDHQQLVDIRCEHGKISSIEPHRSSRLNEPGSLALHQSLATAPFAQWHTHLDKTFTISRARQTEPGLLGAIQACIHDHQFWTTQDIHERAEQALEEAWQSGCTLLRTHVDWVQQAEPLAWGVLQELATLWANRLRLERVALLRIEFFDDEALATRLVRHIKNSGGIVGAFVHSSNATQERLETLVRLCNQFDVAMDLHLDEEINAQAKGLTYLLEAKPRAPTALSHVCALGVKPLKEQQSLIEALAQQNITVIALPATNLYLQDQTEPHQPLTPTLRGIAPVHELRRAGVNVLLSCDNVQDPFYPWGNYDPIALMQLAAPALQLTNCFDQWAQATCTNPLRLGESAEMLIFSSKGRAISADAWPQLPSKPTQIIRSIFRNNALHEFN